VKYDFQKLKNKSNKDIFVELSYLLKAKAKYDFLTLTDEEYFNLCLDEIEKSKQSFDGNTNYYNYVNEKVEKRLDKICELKAKENPYKITNDYINSKVVFCKKYNSCLMEINNLSNFINKYITGIDPSFLLDLVNSNEILNQVLEFIFKNDEIRLKLKEPEDIYSVNILNFIQIYCDSKDIDLYELMDADKNDKEDKDANVKTLYSLSQLSREYPILTSEQEVELYERIKQGDTKAKDIFILSNQRLVMNMALRYSSKTKSLTIEDLYQEGNIGLIRAINYFNADKGYKFSTYATWWIRQAITRAIADKDEKIRKPVYFEERLKKIKKVEEQLLYELNREPTYKEIADKLELTEKQVEDILSYPVVTKSLDMTIKEDEETELYNFIKDPTSEFEDDLEEKFMNQELIELFKNVGLKEREIEVLTLRYGLSSKDPMVLREVGDLLGITRERVRQLENRALKKLRKSRHIKSLSTYMDDSEKALFNVKEMTKLALSKPHSYHNYLNFNFEKEEKQKEVKLTLYDLYPHHKKEELKEIVQNLDEDKKMILYKMYDISLNLRKKPFEMTEEEQKEYKELLKYIHFYNVENQNSLTLKEQNKYIEFLDYVEEQLKGVPKPLNKKGKEKENMKGYKKNATTVYEYFNEYTKEDVDKVIGTLNEEYKALLHKKYGNDLENPSLNEELSKEEYKKYYHCVLRTIRFRLERDYIMIGSSEPKAKKESKKASLKTIYEYFEEYSKEEIDFVIESLKEEQKQLLYKRNGTNLENPNPTEKLNKEESKKYYNVVLRNIKNRLEKLFSKKIEEKDLKEMKGIKKNAKSVFEYFDSYSKEEIDKVVESLNDEYKELLNKKFSLEPGQKMNPEETKRLYTCVFRVMRFRLENNRLKSQKIKNDTVSNKTLLVPQKFDTLYSLLPKYSKELIDEVINELNGVDRDLIYKKYGYDLENPNPTEKLTDKESNSFYSSLLRKIRIKLEMKAEAKKKEQEVKEDDSIEETINVTSNENEIIIDEKEEVKTIKGKKSKIIYDLLEGYTKEEIDELISTLSDYDKDLLYKKYGTDLENPNPTEKLTEKEINRFYNSLVRRMRQKLHDKNHGIIHKKDEKIVYKEEKTLSDIDFNEIPDENVQVKILREKLQEEQNEEMVDKDTLIEMVEKEDTKEPVKEESIKTLPIINDSNANLYLKVFDIIKVMGYEKLIEGLSPLEIVVVLLKFGFVYNVSFETDVLSEFLNVSEEQINEIVKKVIENNKDNVSKFVDDALTNIINNPGVYLKK